MDLTTWILIISAVVVLLGLLVYRTSTWIIDEEQQDRIEEQQDRIEEQQDRIEEIETRVQIEVRHVQEELERLKQESRAHGRDLTEEELEDYASDMSAAMYPTEFAAPSPADRRAAALFWVILIMQVLITLAGLVAFVMIILDGCYGWLGWCPEPASSEYKIWASGLVGTVVGFWLTKGV